MALYSTHRGNPALPVRKRQCLEKLFAEISRQLLSAGYPELETGHGFGKVEPTLKNRPQQGRHHGDASDPVIIQNLSIPKGSLAFSTTTSGTPFSRGPKISAIESTKLNVVF